jgi:hypothetical protein
MPEASAEPSLWARLVDGPYHWGSFDVAAGRHGVRRYRLMMYSPRTSTADRRLARLWRAWPLGGAMLGLLALMLLGNVAASPDTVLEIALAAYVVTGALLFLRAGPAHVQVRSMSVILMPETPDAEELCMYAEWQELVRTLTTAEDMLTTGAISPAEHKATWQHAYYRLGTIVHVEAMLGRRQPKSVGLKWK